MILGYLFAALAALASGSGSILESLGVRRAGAYGGAVGDLVRLRRQWIYFLGLGADLAGFACATAALQRLPLFLVQSVLAFSVGVTATIAAFLGTRMAAAGWAALTAGAIGLVLLGVSAQPGPARALPPGWPWILPAMALPVAAIACYAKRGHRSWAAPVLAFGAGLGFTVVGVAARTLGTPGPVWPFVAAIVLNGLTAAVVFASALQEGSATAVNAIMFTTNTALSSVIGLVWLDDRVRAGFAVAAVAGVVLAMTGAVVTAHYAAAARQTLTAAPAGRSS